MAQPIIAQWIILVGAILPFLLIGIAKSGNYNNSDPRNPSALDTPLRRAANGAHYNSHEAFAFYAAAVLLASLRGADAHTIDLLGIAWLVFRLLFIACYLGNKASLRTATWFGAYIAAIVIFVIGMRAG